MRTLIILAMLAAAPYSGEIAKWRAEREARLRAPEGWLSVTGLFWLREGANTVGSDFSSAVVLPAGAPLRAGIFRLTRNAVRFEPASGAAVPMKPDDPGPATVVRVGNLAMTAVNRGEKMGIRLRDPNAATRREFAGCIWFPADERWRMQAKWTPYTPTKKIPILNILGMTSTEEVAGVAEFTLAGRKLRLEPLKEDDELFFMFRDQTTGKTTYGAGRFLYAAMPKDGTVELDFNKAENPPCAYTAFATCPLPPKSNTLSVAVEAGEKAGKHE